MKRLYLAIVTLFVSAASLFAQNDLGVHFVTVASEGEDVVKVADVADGSTINVSNLAYDSFGDLMINAYLGVENTSDSGKRLQLKYELKAIGSGRTRACVFNACTDATELGTYYVPKLSAAGNHISLGVLKAGRVQDLGTEWFPLSEGSATMRLTLLVGTKTGNKESTNEDIYDVTEGPSVTVNFLYGVTGIADVSASAVTATEYYDLAGRKVAAPTHGVYIARQHTADGKTAIHKVAVK